MSGKRGVPTTVMLPPELRREVERVHERMRGVNRRATLGEAIRSCVAAGVQTVSTELPLEQRFVVAGTPVHDDVSRVGYLLVELSPQDRALVRQLAERLAAK